ncbi:MAG: GNAT family N-acetyltransferase [Lawsonibacter sp.]|jgi:ribosomal-protein-alanine N-acetyltransferase
MELLTPRLLLRPFTLQDRWDLFAYARDPRVGPPAGWSPHESVVESEAVIRTVFASPHVFAVVDRESRKVIGSAGYTGRVREEFPKGSGEIGYALHPDYWGRGLMPEAVQELLQYGFVWRRLAAIWCSHYEENQRSKGVIRRCGFSYCFTDSIVDEPTGQRKLAQFYCMTRQQWEKRVCGERGNGE